MELPADAPTVRLCHLTKWPDFKGYGFHLHTDKAKNIQTLGDIDKGSPAEAAGLMKGDRIVEVNDQNVFNENHRQVVERIMAIPDETRLLVVDPLSDRWYRDRNVVIKGTLPSVKVLTSARDVPEATPAAPPSSTQIANGSSSDVPCPRLCHLRKWPSFDGYGFNLHADKSKGTQYIGVVDPDSPAETAGLKQNDKIIEVNGENVERFSHTELVKRIKSVPNETTLLVVDEPALKHYRDRGIQVTSSMKNVQRLETPSSNPRNNNDTNKKMAMPPLPKTPPPAEAETQMDSDEQNRLVPRKCCLRKWADYEGYGFNLHADKANNLHYIGEVDEGSPAKLGGLKPHDRLVEVNGVNIENIAHTELIQRIKSDPQQTQLLVVCKDTDQHYREKGVVPRGDLPEVKVLQTPAREVEAMENDTSSKSSTPKMLPSTPSSNRSEELPPPTPSTTVDEYDVNGINSPSPAMNMEPPAYNDARNGRSSVESPTMVKDINTRMGEVTLSETQDNGSLERSTREGSDGGASPIFSMSASDFRQMLRQQKKKDPRVQNMDLMQKFKIIEQL